jgi:hypothetical protein
MEQMCPHDAPVWTVQREYTCPPRHFLSLSPPPTPTNWKNPNVGDWDVENEVAGWQKKPFEEMILYKVWQLQHKA